MKNLRSRLKDRALKSQPGTTQPDTSLRLTTDEILEYRNKLRKGLEAAAKVASRIPETIENDIQGIIENPIQPPQIIDSEQAMRDATRALSKIQKRRNRVLAMQVSCIDVRDTLKQIYEECKGWLLQEARCQDLKNETMRSAFVRQVLNQVERKVARLDRYLKQIDAIHWALKGNQDALLSQIGLWKHEYWTENRRDG